MNELIHKNNNYIFIITRLIYSLVREKKIQLALCFMSPRIRCPTHVSFVNDLQHLPLSLDHIDLSSFNLCTVNYLDI